MTTYYVGKGGDNANDGTTWVLRKLTIAGAEALSLVGDDVVYVGPGTYREALATSDSGSSGSPITFIGDQTGENTDGIGGAVRWTGSNDDRWQARSQCISVSHTYRTFQGFHLDGAGVLVRIYEDTAVFTDCVFEEINLFGFGAVWVRPNKNVTFTVKRCLFLGHSLLEFYDPITSHTANDIRIENCIFIGSGMALAGKALIQNGNFSHIVVVNCTIITMPTSGNGSYTDQFWGTWGGTSDTSYLYNCLFVGENDGTVNANVLNEGYNTWGRQGIAKDSDIQALGNSNDDPILLNPPLMLDGFPIPWMAGEVAPYSAVIGQACNSEAPDDDFFGIPRPTSDAKKTRGPIQASFPEKSDAVTEGKWDYSIKLPDAMATQFMVPVTGGNMRFDVEVYREADYTGVLPQLIVRQPGQSPQIDTDVGAVSQFNSLSLSFTPASSPPYVFVELRSDNTATSGNYGTYFSSLQAR